MTPLSASLPPSYVIILWRDLKSCRAGTVAAECRYVSRHLPHLVPVRLVVGCSVEGRFTSILHILHIPFISNQPSNSLRPPLSVDRSLQALALIKDGAKIKKSTRFPFISYKYKLFAGGEGETETETETEIFATAGSCDA